MTSAAHVEAVKTLIAEAVRLYVNEVPARPELPYAVLFMGGGARTRVTLAPVADRRNVEFQVTSVGLDDSGMRSVQDRTAAAVLDHRPVVPGRHTSPIWQMPGAGDLPRVDRDVTPHRVYVVDRYRFASTPAPQPEEI